MASSLSPRQPPRLTGCLAGDTTVIGGLALEFFTRNGRVYNQSTPEWNLEPHVAKAVFMSMLAEANVTVYYNASVSGQRPVLHIPSALTERMIPGGSCHSGQPPDQELDQRGWSDVHRRCLCRRLVRRRSLGQSWRYVHHRQGKTESRDRQGAHAYPSHGAS